ncbi:hypothetical protein Tco_1542973, partial [Tanacetum coccineum]
DLEAAFEYPGEFHSPSFLMIYWGGNDAKCEYRDDKKDVRKSG